MCIDSARCPDSQLHCAKRGCLNCNFGKRLFSKGGKGTLHLQQMIENWQSWSMKPCVFREPTPWLDRPRRPTESLHIWFQSLDQETGMQVALTLEPPWWCECSWWQCVDYCHHCGHCTQVVRFGEEHQTFSAPDVVLSVHKKKSADSLAAPNCSSDDWKRPSAVDAIRKYTFHTWAMGLRNPCRNGSWRSRWCFCIFFASNSMSMHFV